jgi:hypothetical protein
LTLPTLPRALRWRCARVPHAKPPDYVRTGATLGPGGRAELLRALPTSPAPLFDSTRAPCADRVALHVDVVDSPIREHPPPPPSRTNAQRLSRLHVAPPSPPQTPSINNVIINYCTPDPDN